MKIEKIVIHNLTSIEGEQIIDFTEEPLRSAGLFAITGNTGAGKSTILDAICLALYNRAPRFDNVGDSLTQKRAAELDDPAQRVPANNVAGILRRGQKEGGASVTFSTFDGERYEAVWSMRVKRGGSYATPVRTLNCLTPKKERITGETAIKERIEQATCLTYEQFTRTVILAQNSFANFLRAKSGEKAELLEKLTGTEVYSEISRRIFEDSAAAENVVREMESQMQGLLHDRLSSEELAETENEKNLLTANRRRLAEELALIARRLDWFAAYDKASVDVAEAETALHSATRALDEVRADRLRLDRYDLLLPMQPLFQEIVMRRADIEKLKIEEATVTATLEKARGEIRTLTAALETARERTADAERQQALRTPAINRGYALTGEMSIASDQLSRSNEQLRIATDVVEKRAVLLQTKQENLSVIRSRVEDLSLHEQSLAVHRQMFEKYDLIKEKLSMLQVETERNTNYHRRGEELHMKREQLKSRSENAEKEHHKRQAQMNTLRSELLIHQEANRGRDSAHLQSLVAESKTHLAVLRRAAILWKHISEGYVALSEKRAALMRGRSDINRRLAELERSESAFTATREAYDRIHTTYTLSQTQDLVRLRQQLKEGTACPVCGATHHPYHTETERELGELLDNLSREYEEMTERLKTGQDDLQHRREEIAACRAALEADTCALRTIEQRQEADIEEWIGQTELDKSIADCSPSVNSEARRVTIEMLIDSNLRAADEADAELKDHNNHQAQINRLNEEIAMLDGEMTDNREQIDRLRTESRIAAATAEELQRDTALSDKAFAELYADLGEMVTLSGWFADWKRNADAFRMRLGELLHDWTATRQALERERRSADLLTEEIKAAENSLEEARRGLVATRDVRDGFRERIGTMEEELRRLLGGITPKDEATRLQRAISEARQEEQRVNSEHKFVEDRLHELEGRRANLQNSRFESAENLQKRQEEFDLLVLRFNGKHSPTRFSEMEEIFSDTSDRIALRRRLDTLAETRLIADRHLKETRDYLLALQADTSRPETTDEAARNALKEGREIKIAEEEETVRRLTLVDSRLLSHQRCVERAEALQHRIDKAREEATEWERLNHLFGSRDGKKFRTIAQSYTFARLVDYANHHLRLLSPRYELSCIQGTLALEVIDHHMLDEHRYTSSLSGGETFVVSLALALALASVSSTTLAIGSLFIDEGFGNLDRASLDLVMQALSNLENTQGRKVGIISHTEQIRAQISPQVRLKRLPGGNHSVIEVR